MTTPPTVVTPGWYPDGVTPGIVRWFDGSAWTEHTAPDPALAQQAAPQALEPTWAGHAAAQSGGQGKADPYWQPQPTWQSAQTEHGPSSAMHWIAPVGRSWQSILAGYLGLISLAVWVLGPVAIGFGIWALVRAQSGGHGRGRAVFGIIGGLVGCAILAAFAFSAAAA